jgi:hypothetical protein
MTAAMRGGRKRRRRGQRLDRGVAEEGRRRRRKGSSVVEWVRIDLPQKKG